MKGITHFIVGVALASCFPDAVQMTLHEKSLILLLGGLFGLLPDTIDFRFLRYMERHHFVLDPGISALDPRRVTDGIIAAIHRTAETGKTTKVRLGSLKMGADTWRRYSVRFDTANRRITTRVGPIVSTSQMPYPGTEPPEESAVASGAFRPELVHTYDEELYIDILTGPDFAFVKDDGRVRLDFIHWHRNFTHSLGFALLMAPFGFLLYGLTPAGLTVALVIAAAVLGHIAADYTGLMGSNILSPFTTRRTRGLSLRLPGLGMVRSSHALPNFFTNYIAGAVILWNLNGGFGSPPLALPLPAYIAGFVVAPLAVLYGLTVWHIRLHPEDPRFPGRPTDIQSERAKEILSTVEDTSGGG